MKRYKILFVALLLLILPGRHVHAQGEAPVVHAVLFYSPTCGHCEYVINETLLPMVDEYGDRLQIIGIDVTQQQGQMYFQSVMQKFKLESAGVPFLVIDDTYMVGSADIPERFPGMVETYLAQGGVDWPDIPGLNEMIASSTEAQAATPAVSTQSSAPQPTAAVDSALPDSAPPEATPGLLPPESHDISWKENFSRDLAGNTLAVIVLLGMLASIVWAIIYFKRPGPISIQGNWARFIPFLCILGFFVAGYLAYVETTQVAAVCGPVGDCNTVQQSEYARLFGVLPIGTLGLLGYVAMFIAWLVARFAGERLSRLAVLSLFTMTVFGTLFSIYLTFLEPFVIGATCAWCLTSAILMTILMLLSARPAKAALSRLQHAEP